LLGSWKFFENPKPIQYSAMASPHFVYSVSSRPVAEVESELAPSTVHGADLRFHGVVRDSEEGRPLAGIDYTHYETMAAKELGRIGEAMGREHPGHRALVHHVVGYVPAGVASILIRVQTAHSAEAFEICREYLKRIKATVPIWKRPVFADLQDPDASV
jgi:molybdopterin synthase catalytic subunit